MKYNTVLFDFDGTTADTGRGVKNSIKYALSEHGIPVGDESRLDYFIGPPLYVSFEHVYGVSAEKASELVDTYRVYYAEKGIYELDPYPGMLDLIKELKASGRKVGIASSKPKHFLDAAVKYLELDDVVGCVVGPELKNHEANKTSLILSALDELGETPSSQAVMIGDRFYDIEGAVGAGVSSIGISFGYGSKEELEKAGSDAVADSVSELRALLLK